MGTINDILEAARKLTPEERHQLILELESEEKGQVTLEQVMEKLEDIEDILAIEATSHDDLIPHEVVMQELRSVGKL